MELADWSLSDALQSAREDLEWNSTKATTNDERLKSGQIRMTWKQAATGFLDLTARGAGLVRRTVGEEKEDDGGVTPVSTKAVAAKRVQDMHAVADQHNSFGMEMQSISKSS